MAFVLIPNDDVKISVGDIEPVTVDFSFKLRQLDSEVLIATGLNVDEGAVYLADITDETINGSPFYYGKTNRQVAASNAVQFTAQGTNPGIANITITVQTDLGRKFIRTLYLEVVE